MTIQSKFHLALAACVLMTALAGGAAHAQGAVRINTEAFQDNPTLPLAPAAGQRAVAGQSATAVAAPAGFVLRGGEPIHVEVARWASLAGWDLHWQARTSWRTLRDTAFPQSEVTAAITEVVEILRDEGKPLVLRISAGNKVMEVLSTEVRND